MRSDAILRGAKRAAQAHLDLGLKEQLEHGIARIDVFAALATAGAELMFRPLDGLLGAYIGPPVVDMHGVIVSTKRELHVQRFTAAHELGHLLLGHKPSYDADVGLWRSNVRDGQEIEADSFASDFMLPRWLYHFHARRHGWTKTHLSSPDVVYQLSLRLGASYQATCYGLSSHKIVPSGAVERLLKVTPKEIKTRALAGNRGLLDNSWANVWTLTEADRGLWLEGGPDDVFVFKLKQSSGAGYLWDESALAAVGLQVLDDLHDIIDDEMGSPVDRSIVTRAVERRDCHVVMNERRPWRDSEVGAAFDCHLDLFGKEQAGLPRFARAALIAA
jgi:hypothetical protein